MPQLAEAPTATVGGLVVLNGKLRGERLPLRLPVTLIGSGPRCDVRLTAPGVADIHCMIVASPVGLIVRSLDPSSTKLNGAVTAAAALAHGSELTVGPCSFRVVWSGTFVSAIDPAPTTGWQASEREATVHEQEAQLAAVLEERQTQIASLLDQLADKRETVRSVKAEMAADRQAAKAARAEAEKLAAERIAERNRTRQAAARLLEAIHAKGVAEQEAIARAKSEVASTRAAVRVEQDRVTLEVADVTDRLQQGWSLLTAGQQALAADRQRTEAELSTLFQMLDARTAEGEAERTKRDADRAERQAESESLRAEIAGLEQRLANLQPAVQRLEDQRAGLLAELHPAVVVEIDPVPLDWRDDRSADQIVSELLVRERELDRERRTVAATRAELDRLSEALADERTVLAEKLAAISADRRAEVDTLAEMHELAEAVAVRDQQTMLREQAADQLDASRRERERMAWRFQAKLEQWQAAVGEHEARLVARFEQAETDLAAHRGEVLGRERELTEICRVWDGLRTSGLRAVRDELDRGMSARAEYRAAVEDCDKQMAERVAEATRLAAAGVAVEAAKAELEKSPRAARRLRVLRRRWEKHFRQRELELDRRRQQVRAEATTLDAKCRELQHQTAAALAAKAAAEAARVEADRVALTHGLDQEAVPLTMVEVRRLDGELDAIREAASAAAAELEAEDFGAGLLPLRYAV